MTKFKALEEMVGFLVIPIKMVCVLLVIAIITFLILDEILDLTGHLNILIDNQTKQTLEITSVNYSDNIARISSLGFVWPGQLGVVSVDDDADYWVIYARDEDNEMIYKKSYLPRKILKNMKMVSLN